MNSIRQIKELNKRELEAGVSTSASWHADYRDTAYIYIGGLPFELSEGDIITIFSQYGEPTYINLVRDKETGKSKGFCFLKYEDQRSTDLAIDNLGGATVMGRMLRVDHSRYKEKDDEELQDNTGGDPTVEIGSSRTKKRTDETESEAERERPLIKEEIELAKLIREHDNDDPMKGFLIEQKQEEVKSTLKALKRKNQGRNGEKRKHRQHESEMHDKSEDDHARPRTHSHKKHQDDASSGDDRNRRRHRHHNHSNTHERTKHQFEEGSEVRRHRHASREYRASRRSDSGEDSPRKSKWTGHSYVKESTAGIQAGAKSIE